jgi:hypothetical protein
VFPGYSIHKTGAIMTTDPLIVQREISEPRLFIQQTLLEARKEDLFEWVDRYRLSEPLVEFVLQLSLQEGATVENMDSVGGPILTEANALIPGTRVHLNLKKVGWAAVSAALPLLVSIIQIILGDHSKHANVVAALLSVANALPGSFHLLTGEQKAIYLTVAALSTKSEGATVASVSSVLASIPDYVPEPELESKMNGLVKQAVLKCEAGLYTTIF